MKGDSALSTRIRSARHAEGRPSCIDKICRLCGDALELRACGFEPDPVDFHPDPSQQPPSGAASEAIRLFEKNEGLFAESEIPGILY